jgi:hypothetical protein
MSQFFLKDIEEENITLIVLTFKAIWEILVMNAILYNFFEIKRRIFLKERGSIHGVSIL